MIVVDDRDRVCFSETICRWSDNSSSTYADKKGSFFDEYIKGICEDFAVKNNLVSYGEWKKILLEEKEKAEDKSYDEDWLFCDCEVSVIGVSKKFNFYGKKLIIKVTGYIHSKCNYEWHGYMLQDEFENNVRICGYKIFPEF